MYPIFTGYSNSGAAPGFGWARVLGWIGVCAKSVIIVRFLAMNGVHRKIFLPLLYIINTRGIKPWHFWSTNRRDSPAWHPGRHKYQTFGLDPR
jgi:hypothetical protein